MKTCTLINGITLQGFEDQINRMFADDESAQLAGLLFVPGTGFIAAIVSEAKERPPARPDRQLRHGRRAAKPKAAR